MSVLRQVEVKDYTPIIQVIDEWWGGSPMAGMIQRLFFEHFQPTSFVIEQDVEVAGFLNQRKASNRHCQPLLKEGSSS